MVYPTDFSAELKEDCEIKKLFLILQQGAQYGRNIPACNDNIISQ